MNQEFEERIASLLSNQKELIPSYQSLSARYRTSALLPGFHSDGERLAYIGARLPATYAVMERVLFELSFAFNRFSLPGSLRTCLDLGAGPGVSTVVAKNVFPALTRLTLIDQDAKMLALACTLLEDLSFFSKSSLHFQALNLLSASFLSGQKEELPNALKESATQDLVLLSYLFGEIPTSKKLKLLERAFMLCAKALVIVLPGTPEDFRILLSLRQWLIDQGAFIAAPCPHQLACPLDPLSDWCHFSTRLERKEWHRSLKQASLGFEDEKFCYLIAFKPDLDLSSRETHPAQKGRVIRSPLKRSGHILVDLCEGGELRRVSLSKRQKEDYKTARSLKWGDRF